MAFRKGCDSCCRNLAELPRLTRAEWEILTRGLALLPPIVHSEIEARMRALQPGDRICPFLDTGSGTCLVYDHRPVDCRMHGFYVERDGGLYCRQIEERVNAGEMSGVVWGNAAAIESRLAGERIGIIEWFNDSLRGSLPLLPTPP